MPARMQIRGFSLIELMVVLALVAIAAFIALPSFTSLVERNRTQALAEEFKVFLSYARGEAITKNTPVIVNQADAQSWVVMQGNTALRQLQTDSSAQILADVNKITFAGNGTSTAGNFIVCADNTPATGYLVNAQNSGAIEVFKRGEQDADGGTLSSCQP